MSNGQDIIGSLFEEDGPVKSMPEVEITPDGQKAYIIFPEKPITTDLRALLSDHGIAFNIDADLLADLNKRLYDGLKLDSQYLIAKGKKPVEGQPGELILRTKKPEDIILSSEDLEQVDYKVYKRKMLAIAEEDKPVAMIIEPTKGFDGMDVYGNVLPGNDGEEVILNLGDNVYRQGKKLISKIDGLITYKKNRDGSIDFDISEVYVVQGDVDYNTGNIDFPGSVMVRGIIKAGFEVIAKNEVIAETIRGNVVAGGSVVAKQGIIGGTQRANIRSSGSVYAKFLQFAEITTEDSVLIKKSILSSVIYAQGEVKVEGSPGSIIGGNIYASQGVEAKVFGSESFVKTEVALYESAKDVIILRQVVERRFETSKMLTKIESYLGGTKKELIDTDEEKKEMIRKLLKKRDELRRTLLEVNVELKSLQKMLTKPVNGRVVVSRQIWPEVRVSIAGKFILLKNERGKGYFFYDKEKETIDFK